MVVGMRGARLFQVFVVVGMGGLEAGSGSFRCGFCSITETRKRVREQKSR